MDSKNLFETTATYRIQRLEYFTGLVSSLGALVLHYQEVRWGMFAALFLCIDLIGYLPGAVAYRRSRTGKIGRHYYVLYNTMHSLVTGAVVVLLWWCISGPEWALLAVPIHLFGDRSVFGNFMKPFSVSFEPAAHPDYLAFQSNYNTSVDRWK